MSSFSPPQKQRKVPHGIYKGCKNIIWGEWGGCACVDFCVLRRRRAQAPSFCFSRDTLARLTRCRGVCSSRYLCSGVFQPDERGPWGDGGVGSTASEGSVFIKRTRLCQSIRKWWAKRGRQFPNYHTTIFAGRAGFRGDHGGNGRLRGNRWMRLAQAQSLVDDRLRLVGRQHRFRRTVVWRPKCMNRHVVLVGVRWRAELRDIPAESLENRRHRITLQQRQGLGRRWRWGRGLVSCGLGAWSYIIRAGRLACGGAGGRAFARIGGLFCWEGCRRRYTALIARRMLGFERGASAIGSEWARGCAREGGWPGSGRLSWMGVGDVGLRAVGVGDLVFSGISGILGWNSLARRC